ncbi:MAG: endonuclease III domain-containing protein [Candidatus Norongarragalinales archaeon]
MFEVLYSAYGPQGWWPVTSSAHRDSNEARFEIMLGAILTQNTAWSNVEKAIACLKRKKLLSVKSIAAASLKEIKKCVRSAGYYNQKARYVRDLARYLEKHYGGDLALFFSQPPGSLRKELLSLRGIGRETADSILLYAGGKRFFVVDAYTRRVFTRLGVLRGNENYEEVRAFFEAGLPRDEKIYGEFHALIVELAKRCCFKKKPVCEECPLQATCRRRGV